MPYGMFRFPFQISSVFVFEAKSNLLLSNMLYSRIKSFTKFLIMSLPGETSTSWLDLIPQLSELKTVSPPHT